MANTRGVPADAGVDDISRQAADLVREASMWIGQHSLDIAMASGAGVLVALILVGVRSLGCRIIARSDGDLHWRTILARTLARTNMFFIVMCAAELVAEHASTPPALLRFIHVLFVIAAAFQAALWARELTLGLIEHRIGNGEEHGNLGSAVGIIRLLVTVALFAVAIVVILDNLGVNVTGLIAGLGIGGIAIGLAAQGIFSDLFAALAIIFDKPFRRGDTIHFGDLVGTVEQIGLKTTRIRSLQGEQVVVSNAKLLEERLHNYTLFQRRRLVMHFGVIYQTAPDVLARLQDELRAIVEKQSHATFDRAHIYQFAPSSIDFELVFYIETAAMEVAMEARQGIMLNIMRRFAELGVDFAYPTQTTFTAAPDGRMVMPYAEAKGA